MASLLKMADPMIFDDTEDTFASEALQSLSSDIINSTETSNDHLGYVRPHDLHRLPASSQPVKPVPSTLPAPPNDLYLSSNLYDPPYQPRTGSVSHTNSHGYNYVMSQLGNEGGSKRLHEEEDSASETEDENARYRRPSSEPPPDKSRPSNKRQRIDEEVWDEYRDFIGQLYFHQKKTLGEVMKVMEGKHGFKASKTAYKTHLRIWFPEKKNISHDYKRFMLERLKRRREEGKDTGFRYFGKQYPIRKLERRSTTYSKTVSVTSTPAGVSIYTPSEQSRGHSNKIGDRSHSKASTAMAANQHSESLHNKGGETVVIHQRTSNLSEPEPIENPASIEDRLDNHSYTHKSLFDELGTMPVTELEALLRRPCVSRSHWATNPLLENILMKFEEEQEEHNRVSPKKQEYAVFLAQAMVLQHQYWRAGQTLKALCSSQSSLNFRSDQMFKLLKLRLLTDVGDNFESPRLLSQIEGRCKVIVAKESETPSYGCQCPRNLVMAYLFRIYGIKDRILDPSTIAKMSTALEEQFSLRKVPMSAIWAAQQYIRWALRNKQPAIAEKTLASVQLALKTMGHGKDLEADQNAKLYELLQSVRRPMDGSVQALEDVAIYERTPVDDRWLEAFRAYIWDETHACPEDVRRTRDMDGEYYH